jgi:hypothetical protein
VSVPIVVFAALLGLSACQGRATVPVHGRVLKVVGRPCDLLSAAFPSVEHRTVSFVDETGTLIGRTVSGAQRIRPIGSGGCELSSSFEVALPLRNTYAADVSSDTAAVPTSTAMDYDTLAGRGWRFDVRIPATA